MNEPNEQERINEYLNLLTCSPRRINKVRNVLFIARKIIKKDLTKLQEINIAQFLREINNSDFKSWTKNDYKKLFKAFLRWYYKEKLLKWLENPNIRDGFRGVSKSKAFNKEKINKTTLLQPEELEKLLRACNTLKLKALFTLLYESAFRPCEIRVLRWQDLTFDDARNICSVKTISPKTKEMRVVPVKDCVVHLKRWRDEYQYPNRTEKDFVFPGNVTRNNPLAEGTITQLLARLSKEAGLRHLYPYLFRHSRIYEIQKKLGARISSKFAGHSIEVSEIYNHLDSDDVEEAMLEKVYVTEELSPEEEAKVQEQLTKLKKEQKEMISFVRNETKRLQDKFKATVEKLVHENKKLKSQLPQENNN